VLECSVSLAQGCARVGKLCASTLFKRGILRGELIVVKVYTVSYPIDKCPLQGLGDD